MILLAFLCLAQSWTTPLEPGKLLWPIGDGETPPKIHQTYGQAEVMGSVKLHAGLDLVPEAGCKPEDECRAVWSLEDGTIVRIDRDEDGMGKKAGIVVASAAVPGRAFLYMHLDPASIQLDVGYEVEVDEYLGEVLQDDGKDTPEHLHLSRLGCRYEDEAAVSWASVETLSVRNPLKLIDPDLHQDREPPVIVLDEGKLLRRNEVAGAASPNSPAAVVTPDILDVLAQVQDKSGVSGALAPYKIELVVMTGGKKQKFGLILDGPLPLSPGIFYDEGNCTAAPCSFVVTNGSLASNAKDKLLAWCAHAGQHRFELKAWDAAGNESVPYVFEFDLP